MFKVITCFNVPQFDCSVVRAGDDKLVVELQAGDGRLVLVGAGQRLQTAARQDVPDLDSRVGVTRHQDVVLSMTVYSHAHRNKMNRLIIQSNTLPSVPCRR